MAEPRDRPPLLLESRQRRGAPGYVRPEHLHGQAALEVLVPHLVDLGEPASAQQADHPVLPAERPLQGVAAAVVRAGARRRVRVLGGEQHQAARTAARAVSRPLSQGRVAG